MKVKACEFDSGLNFCACGRFGEANFLKARPIEVLPGWPGMRFRRMMRKRKKGTRTKDFSLVQF
jgi:hypothetical protein